MLDVIQISYHEESADENFELLQIFAPLAKQVKGVKGIFNAHKAAAEIAETSHFYVIDADAVIDEQFNFSFRPSSTVDFYPGVMESECVFVWRSRNPVNDLLYGYGGAKLFPRKAMREAENWNVDMTTSIGCPFVPKFQISNITQFNTDPFSAWRSAFRECTKLASAIIPNNDNTDNEYRLKVWQRAFWYGGPTGIPYYYQEENMRSFDLYASNNSVDWTLLGQFDIGDPSDENGNIPQDFIDAAANGHDFDLDGVSEPFRYLKFSLTSNYGSDTYVHGSEITLWGLDDVD